MMPEWHHSDFSRTIYALPESTKKKSLKSSSRSSLSPSYTVTIQAPIHRDSSRFETDGKIGLHRDASGWKKENPASIRCLTMLLRCLHDSSTDPLRLMTAALGFTTVELRMITNAHDASTIRYGASTIQAGSATVASRTPTNLHDLVVVMRQSGGGGGGGGGEEFSFFLQT